MTTITDEFMRYMMFKSKDYCIVSLKATRKINEPGAETVLWEHGRRNFELRASGVLMIICYIPGKSFIKGSIGIFNGSVVEVKKIVDEDPAVKAGVFTCEIHACRSFPGDNLR